jgi:tRNA A-37 threonylcarbamoyl transferase component Bud32
MSDYIAAVAECVYRSYDGAQDRWHCPDSGPVRRISLGGRAGVVAVSVDGRPCCAKLYYDGRLRTRWRVRMGLAKARRACRSGLRLEQLGVRSPRILGYAEQRPGQLTVLVMELLAGATRLDQWLALHGPSLALVKSAARFVRGMHDLGVTHVDLSPRNLMVALAGDAFEVWLLDCEDARFWRRISEQARLADLHHLHERVLCIASLRDRLRFLREYTGQNNSPWQDVLGGMIETSRSKYAKAYRASLRSRSACDNRAGRVS